MGACDDGPRVRAIMGRFFFTLVLPIVALVAGGYVARHAFTEGMHTILTSQPAMPKWVSPGPSMWDGPCSLDSHLQYKNPAACRMQSLSSSSTVVSTPSPIQTMSKAESEKAGSWFMLAAFAIPLSLGGAALIGFLIFYAVRTE